MLGRQRDAEVPRPEHPNPIFRRGDWLNLNGSSWTYAVSRDKRLEPPETWDGRIRVPFCLQSKLSGAKALHSGPLAPGLKKAEVLWYRRELPPLPKSWRDGSKRVLLHIGACDGTATIIVNGHTFAEHAGGSTPFSHDISRALSSGHDGSDQIFLRCTEQSCEGPLQPCGKQLAKFSEYSGAGPHLPTLYSNVSGIWQTVWLEAVSKRAHLLHVKVVPYQAADGHSWLVDLHPQLPNVDKAGLFFEASIFEGSCSTALCTGRKRLKSLSGGSLRLRIPADAVQLWSPEHPWLYRLQLRLREGQGREVIDEVESYTALRTIECKGDQVYLNGEALYLRLVLDQGYYHDGIWTAPTDEALRNDIVLAKEIGFNGARLHQKVFEPRYHFYADVLGFLVVAEYPDWPGGMTRRWKLTEDYKDIVRREWEYVVTHLHNHPSIIMWGPFNEFGPKDGWKYNRGMGGGFKNMYSPAKRTAIIKDQTRFVREVVRRIRKQDKQKRPVHDSSGWIHISTDIWSFHDYSQRPEYFATNLASPPPKFVEGRKGQPLVVAEYGGVGFDNGGPFGKNPKKMLAGYNGRPGLPDTKGIALDRIEGLTLQIYQAPRIAGFCYTQLYDVEYEKNGLLRYDRKPKFCLKSLGRIFNGSLQTGRWAGVGVRRSIHKSKAVPRWLLRRAGRESL